MVVFTRSDPARKAHRFYVVQLAPTLFGEWTVLREWGRIGSPGTVRSTSFASEQDAQQTEEEIVRRRLRRGYTMREAG